MPIIKDFEIEGLRAVIYKHDSLGHLCGYIGLPNGHRLDGRHYDSEDVPQDIHGGWTYSEDHAPGEKPDGLWYLGFDCAHAGDLIPSSIHVNPDDVFRDAEFVESELRSVVPILNAAPEPQVINTDTSAEAVERIRKYIDYPHTSPETVVLDSDLVRITASDLRALLAERDELQAQLEKACRLAEAVSKQTAGNGTQVISPETAAALADFNKARGEE